MSTGNLAAIFATSEYPMLLSCEPLHTHTQTRKHVLEGKALRPTCYELKANCYLDPKNAKGNATNA